MSFQLETAFTFSDTIKPICLANGILQNNFKPAPAVISGWGQTSGMFSFLSRMTLAARCGFQKLIRNSEVKFTYKVTVTYLCFGRRHMIVQIFIKFW